MTVDNQKIYDNFRSIVNEQGTTLKQLSTESGVKYNTMRAWGDGVHDFNPRLDTLIKIIYALDVPFNRLIDGAVIE